jgi:hypothetical protein
MLNKLKQTAVKVAEDVNRRKAEKKKNRLEKQVIEARREKERIEKEKAELEAERQRLLTLSDKEIMIEMIFAVRGFYEKLSALEREQCSIRELIDCLDERISDIEIDIECMKTNSSDTEYNDT